MTAPAAIEEHGVTEPAWVTALAEAVRDTFRPLGVATPVGYYWLEPSSSGNLEDCWVVVAYPTPYECAGGLYDGARAVSGFLLDIHSLLKAFSLVEAVAWQSPTQYNGPLDGPEIAVRGLFAGKPVWLRVFSVPPPDEPVSCVVEARQGTIDRKGEPGAGKPA